MLNIYTKMNYYLCMGVYIIIIIIIIIICIKLVSLREKYSY